MIKYKEEMFFEYIRVNVIKWFGLQFCLLGSF